MSIRCIGIDPGLRKTGWAIIERHGNSFKYIASGNIKTYNTALHARLKILHNGISEVINKYNPNIASIEEVFVNNNYKSSIKLSHARGALLLSISLHTLPIYEYSAALIKKSFCGNGRAEKQQMLRMLPFLIPNTNITDPDEADAIASAVCHFHHQGRP